MSDPRPKLTPELLKSLDDAYAPFPAVRSWSSSGLKPFDVYVSELEQAKVDQSDDSVETVLEQLMRSAAFDTGALEDLYATDRGLTVTVAEGAAGWESEVRKFQDEQSSGDNAIALFEAQLNGYRLAAFMGTEDEPITEASIRELHRVLTEPQETYRVMTDQGFQEQKLPKGVYKSKPNHVKTASGWHSYCPVGTVAPEMARFVDDLRNVEFKNAHPVVRAAYAHYAIAAIHPFADGNGRVARALASVFLGHDLGVPFLLYRDRKDVYLDTLGSADQGDLNPLIKLFEEAAREAVLGARSELALAGSEDIAELSAEFKTVLISERGLTWRQQDQLGETAHGRLLTMAEAELKRFKGPAEFRFHVNSGSGNPGAIPAGYRVRVDGKDVLQLRVRGRSSEPLPADYTYTFSFLMGDDASSPYDVLVVVHETGDSEGLTKDAIQTWELNVGARMEGFVRATIGKLAREVLNAAQTGRQELKAL